MEVLSKDTHSRWVCKGCGSEASKPCQVFIDKRLNAPDHCLWKDNTNFQVNWAREA